MELRSQYEEDHPSCDISRDLGLSVPLPGQPNQSLWLFGDLSITGGESCDYKSFGTHGAISVNTPGAVPVVSEIPTPGLHGAPGEPVGPLPNGDRRPERFLPNPTGLVTPDGSPCNASVSWATSAAVGPPTAMTLYDDGNPVQVANGNDLVFIPYQEVCVEVVDAEPLVLDYHIERVSMVAWRASTNSIEARWTLWDEVGDGDDDVVVDDPWLTNIRFVGTLGLLGYEAKCTSDEAPEPTVVDCGSGQVVARGVELEDLHDPAGYKWFTGTSFSTDRSDAALLHPESMNGGGALFTAVADFSSVGAGIVMLDQIDNIDGSYQLWHSTHDLFDWSFAGEGTLPGADCDPDPSLGCYSIQAHPEISTPNALIFTVYDSASGEIEVTSVPAP